MPKGQWQVSDYVPQQINEKNLWLLGVAHLSERVFGSGFSKVIPQMGRWIQPQQGVLDLFLDLFGEPTIHGGSFNPKKSGW